MNTNLSIITLITVVLLIGLVGAVSATSVTVAASNSAVKNTAQYICDGSNDQSEIQAAINTVTASGGDVVLLDGTFNLKGDVKLAQGVNLIGAGTSTTTLNFIGEGWVQIYGSNTVRDIQSTGPTGFIIVGSHVRMTNVNVKNYTVKSGAFHIYAFNQALTDFVFTNCNAIDGWSFGFLNMGEGSPNSISDITYSGCTAINCGRTSQLNPWVTGFDFVEGTDINNLLVENCRAEGSWESGFHFEGSPQKTNVILRNCVSVNNGQKKDSTYGAGFIGGSPSLQYIDCTSENNLVGFRLNGNGATATGCKDIGSIDGFETNDYSNILLTNCESDQAQEWALQGLNCHDVTATNFVINTPTGNPNSKILVDSSSYPSYNMNIQLAGTPTVVTPTVVTPTVVTPTVVTPTVVTPTVVTPTIVTPTIVTPTIVTPTIVTPTIVTPTIVTPTIVTPTETVITSKAGAAISQAPVASFKADVTSGKPSMKVQFTDLSTKSPTSYLWKFGDGTTSTEQNPNHIYTKRGNYTVTEIVKNSAGSNTMVKTKYILVR